MSNIPIRRATATPSPETWSPESMTIVECPSCRERVAFSWNERRRMEINEAGLWELHRHQPAGSTVLDTFSRSMSSKKLDARDFRS